MQINQPPDEVCFISVTAGQDEDLLRAWWSGRIPAGAWGVCRQPELGEKPTRAREHGDWEGPRKPSGKSSDMMTTPRYREGQGDGVWAAGSDGSDPTGSIWQTSM